MTGPQPTAEQVSPGPLRNLAGGGLIGLLAGVAVAVWRDRAGATVRSPEELQALTGMPALAVVPFDRSTRRRQPFVDDPTGAVAESFRRLRTNLRLVDSNRTPKVIVVASALPQEGRSATAVNLAMACAEVGQKVLLVEGDMRRPRLAEVLGLDEADGLSDVLMGNVPIDEAVRHHGYRQLHMLQCGSVPPLPGQLLGSRRMRALLVGERERFDVVVVDTPPLLPVADASLPARFADGVILVVRSGKTPQAAVRAALGHLRAVDARRLGSVLAMQPARAMVGYANRDGEPAPRLARRTVPAPPAARTERQTREASSHDRSPEPLN